VARLCCTNGPDWPCCVGCKCCRVLYFILAKLSFPPQEESHPGTPRVYSQALWLRVLCLAQLLPEAGTHQSCRRVVVEGDTGALPSHPHLQRGLHGRGYVGIVARGRQPGDYSTVGRQGWAGRWGAQPGPSGRGGCVERARFVRPDLSVWVFSDVLDDRRGSGVRPGIAPPEHGAFLQV